jgi:hypothetical protein
VATDPAPVTDPAPADPSPLPEADSAPSTDTPTTSDPGASGDAAGSGIVAEPAPPEVNLTVTYGAAATEALDLASTTQADGNPPGKVAAAVSNNGVLEDAAKASQDFYARAVAGSLDPLSSSGVWSTFGSAAGRFGPWLALLGIAFVLEAVARSALRDRLRAKPVKSS